ncbi:MAG: serine/threonine protein kinase [Planctomycetes bacterium]|jgi:serine/threonine protein kinase|nr:serine/threonine protein kinase [Planctomycetota bacterium]
MTEQQPDRRGARYTLLRELGSGGFGTVHLAHDAVLQRQVALKELRRDLVAGDEATRAALQARLWREVQITGQLEHPGIVPVYDLATDPDVAGAYYTMRLVRGQPLEEAIAQFHDRRSRGEVDPLELPRLLTAVIDVCNAIGYAHVRGVTHRDLKPANVVLGEFGEVVLLDWGLAALTTEAAATAATPETTPARTDAVRLVTDTPHQTGAGGAGGTPAYMAPEQARGEPGPRTDIYGLGGILFDLLTGRPPHVGENSSEVLDRILRGPTPSARAVAPWVPKALDAICARAMAHAPGQRYATASALADDLRRFLADEPVSALSEPVSSRAGRWMRKHRTWTLAAAVVAGITIAVTSFAAVLLARVSHDERQARQAAEHMREQGLHLAAKFAARTIASEIDVRWRILEAAAQSPVPAAALRELAATTVPVDGHAPLQRWLEANLQEHRLTATATSWFVTDARGRQMARSPLQARLLGSDFSFRDYFHGQGRDLPRGSPARPITAPHRSVVFKSRATGNLMVAFSVPIWSEPVAAEREVIGVLAMTVELGSFAALRVELSGEQVAVLVETKSDWLGAAEGQGLVLHHPRLRGECRLSGDALGELRALRSRNELGGLLLRDYIDPVDPEPRWLAVFEPVLVQGRTGPEHDIGWVVGVQERVDPGR